MQRIKMSEKFIRTALLFGHEKMNILKNSHIAVFRNRRCGRSLCRGACAQRCRKKIDLVDSDRVCESNINRQIIATVKKA
ncbi:MAG: hypothetical protein L6V93_15760 [Clostridiales bacterium]|nr:MAG: hypothetical protein L6V93_15760 [Clostridiales bacterium]